MFEQSLLENAAQRGWKKALAVVISTTFQVSLLMILVVMPLIFPESLPKVVQWTGTYITIPQPPEPITERLPRHRPVGGVGIYRPPLDHNPWSEPTGIAKDIDMRPDPAPLGDGPPDLRATGDIGGNDRFARAIAGLPNNLIATLRPPVRVVDHPRDPPPAAAIYVSAIDPAKILNRVQPNYPPLARQTHTQGTVFLEAVIGKTGLLERLRVISGHPLLVPAALEAVNQWRYRPTVLNGEPVEVITTIEVHFTLNQ
jgi:protein TonB